MPSSTRPRPRSTDPPLLRTIAAEPNARAKAAYQDGRLVAFGLARRGRIAAHLGPLVGTTAGGITRTLDSLLTDIADAGILDTVYIDVPHSSPLAMRLEERGFSIARKLTRMVRSLAPMRPFDSMRILAASGFELG